jgi:hypothetical protein
MPSGIVVALRRHKRAVLLALLLVSLAIETFDARGTRGLHTDVFRTVLGLTTWFIVFNRPRERAAMGAVLALTMALSWGRYLAPGGLDHPLALANQSAQAVFLWGAVCAILRDLFRTPAAGAESVLGAICGYLIAGDAWARVNAIAYLLVPSSYSVAPEVAALLHDWHGRVALFTYYAYAQVLTIGYSDVTPIRAPATTLSLFAALFGVFYTAVVVSQFVGLAQSGKPAPPDGK